jgi:hypothetical protein
MLLVRKPNKSLLNLIEFSEKLVLQVNQKKDLSKFNAVLEF